MVVFVIIIVLAIVFGPYVFAAMRIARLRRELGDVGGLPDQVRRLTARVHELEGQVAKLRADAAAAAPVVVPAPVASEPPPVPVQPPPEPTPSVAQPARAAPEPIIAEPRRPVWMVEEPAVEPEPRPAAVEPVARKRTGAEWESLVGGNYLNKLGVLVLIVGIALFLSYSFTRMGPAGRVATAFAVSGAMLAGGVVLERKSVYRIFARGLIGGGWAGIYFTAYAMYAIDAAKVVASPWTASVALALSAAGMIVHSLRYRSQAVSGLAYFIAFATFALTPVTSFSVIALLPLAASLLYLSHRFEWTEMALFGVLATYGACASRGDSGAPLAAIQGIVGLYWLLFEAFVVMRTRRPQPFSIAERCIWPLNLVGFLALSVAKWRHTAPEYLYALLAGFAAVLLISAVLRRRPETDLVERMANGAYEAPITLSAAFLAIAIWLKLTTVWINFGLVVEGEILFAVGLLLRLRYLEHLGGAVCGLAALKLLVIDQPSGARWGRLMEWTPVAALSAALMYANRWLSRTATYFSYGAAVAILLVAGYETPRSFVAVAWFAIAAALFEFGFRKALIEYRIQAYAFTALAMLALGVNNLGRHGEYVAVGLCTLIAYWLALRTVRLAGREAELVAPGMAVCTTLSGIAFAALAAPWKFVGPAWLALAVILLELGLRGRPRSFRWQSYPVAAIGWMHIVGVLLLPANKAMALDSRYALAAAAVLSYALARRVFSTDAVFRTAGSIAGTVCTAVLMWVALPDPAVAPAWALLAVVLMELGLTALTSDPNVLVIQADILGAATFARLFLANFVNMGSTLGVSHRLLTVAPVIASEYYAWYRRRDTRAGRVYKYAAPVLAVLLMRFELGRVLTVAGWAALALVLLWLSRTRNDRDFRLQAIALAALCFWRSWTTNFYIPESLAGVPGRIATGAVVIAAYYGMQFLSRRDDQQVRAFFSILGSALLGVLLFYEVSGGMLTVAWGVQALLLLVAGFAARDRILRLSGLFLFLVCILKLFLYDLRYLETMSRILSFIVLGAVMVAVSWVYTRFRNQIQRYL